MDEKVTFWASSVLSVLALIVLLTNIALINSAHNLQAEVSQRQVALTNGANLSQLNQSLVQALADAAVKNDDKSIRDLLASQGIKLKGNEKIDAKDKTETKK